MENMMSAFLGLVVLALLFSRDRLKQRVSRLEVRLEKLLRHVGAEVERLMEQGG